ncbi:MAG: translation initiation factor IF-2 [Lachnospiraceae bacterium]|nr:translation initiation factor IF-2 [Lachnospiraceae bacterium]
MEIDKNKNTSGDGEVKKKKYSVVFRAGNSQQNSLKTRPQGTGTKPPAKPAQPAGRPAVPGKPSAGTSAKTGTAAPAKPVPAAEKKTGKTESAVPEEKLIPKTQEEAAAPAVSAKPEVSAAPAAAAVETKPEVSPAPAVPAIAEKEAEEKPAARTAEKKTVKAAEKPAEKSSPAAVEEEKTAPAQAAPEAPKAPVRRFVDLSQVRAAEQEAKNRSARTAAKTSAERRPVAGTRPQGQAPAARGTRPAGSGRPAPAGGTGRGFAAQGRSAAVPNKDDDTRTVRRSSATRSGTGRAASVVGSGDFGFGLNKSGKSSKQSQRQAAGAAKENSRNNRADSDEMRRPGGKNARGKGGSIKDLEKAAKAVKPEKAEQQIKVITIPDSLTIQELAQAMKLQPAAIIKKLFLAGKVFTVNQEIDYDTAADIALEFDVVAEQEEKVDLIEQLLQDTIEDKEEDLVPRPPVVCVMGHVDHGKTSLLDAIRKTNVTSGEAGGITQHIGAYTVMINGQKITFLDTPGHEAFTAMRMRGAQATDIAILVVAADDGVMPQTVEAINHAKAAGVEIVVAINKIDKPGANVERVKHELTEYGLIGEEWGGTNIFVPVSAKRGDGIEELLEMLLLVAEMHELKANPNRRARGLVIEAQLDNTRGPVATVLVQKGTLHVGDNVAAGASFGKIRAMLNDKGERVQKATPGEPVEILGLSTVPAAGEVFVSPENEKDARSYAQTFISEERRKMVEGTKFHMSLDDLFSQIQSGNMKELNLIVKADVQGSVEAVKTSLTKLTNEEVAVKVIHSGAGNITESDVTLAAASNAIVIGFNVKIDNKVKAIAEQEKVDVRMYDVIYKAIEDVQNAMLGILEPVYEEQIVGHAVIRQVFKASGIGSIAGSYVLDGKIVRNCKCRVKRGEEQLFDGALASLKRFKDDVKEVAAGYECGLVFEKFNEFAVDDTIEAYTLVQVERKLAEKKA